jgi:2-polyprenyl-3-methyl-5-hydroxy-6-metoxy-1,4-benzoquinol methylase
MPYSHCRCAEFETDAAAHFDRGTGPKRGSEGFLYDLDRMARRATVAAEARRTSVAKYDAAYAANKDFVARPNAFLACCLRLIAHARGSRRKVRALDIGLGQGRNAVLIARSGYDTTGIDRSEVGVLAAQRLAAARGVCVNAVLADTEEFDFGRRRWDLIALLYYPQPMILIERLKAAVRPGGHIVIERFSRPECAPGANRLDRRETRRPSPMLESFVGWHVLRYENDELESDWHWAGESPRGAIVRLLARKPHGS